MPWYLRKALTHGPIRVNLSKSGLGASIGVTGLRVGIGPKGTYVHGGRYGLYYRKYLNGPQAQYRDRSPALPIVADEPGEDIERVAVPAADDEVAAEINARLSAFRPSAATFWLAILIGIALIVSHQSILAIVVTAAMLVTAYFLSRRESAERRIEFTYDLEGNAVSLYQNCIDAFGEAAKCAAIWRIVTQTASRDVKYTAGAGATVERSLTQIVFDDPTIRANLRTVWLSVAGGKLCVLPDRMFFFSRSGVSSLDYGDLRIEATVTDFRESGTVPPDSTNVGATWQYVNKTGGPDRRFSNNRRLPIQRYSELTFTHTKLSFRIEFSRFTTADIIVKAMRSLAAAYPLKPSDVTTQANSETPYKPVSPSDTVTAKAAVANVKAAIADLASSGRKAPVVCHFSPRGAPDKIKAWLTSLSDEVERLLKASGPLFEEARHPSSIDDVLILDSTQALQQLRSTLAELSAAVTAFTHIPEGHVFAEGLDCFLQAAARIEHEFNKLRMPATFAPINVQFAAMVNEMLADISKWPNQLREQAAALGTATSCKFDLAFTFDTATLIVGITQAAAALLTPAGRCAEVSDGS